MILTLIDWQISIEKYVPKHFSLSLLNNFKNPILKIIPPKWTIYEDFKDWICALAEQMCTVKTSDRSQMNPLKISQKYCNLSSTTNPFKLFFNVIWSVFFQYSIKYFCVVSLNIDLRFHATVEKEAIVRINTFPHRISFFLFVIRYRFISYRCESDMKDHVKLRVYSPFNFLLPSLKS